MHRLSSFHLLLEESFNLAVADDVIFQSYGWFFNLTKLLEMSLFLMPLLHHNLHSIDYLGENTRGRVTTYVHMYPEEHTSIQFAVL